MIIPQWSVLPVSTTTKLAVVEERCHRPRHEVLYNVVREFIKKTYPNEVVQIRIINFSLKIPISLLT